MDVFTPAVHARYDIHLGGSLPRCRIYNIHLSLFFDKRMEMCRQFKGKKNYFSFEEGKMEQSSSTIRFFKFSLLSSVSHKVPSLLDWIIDSFNI